MVADWRAETKPTRLGSVRTGKYRQETSPAAIAPAWPHKHQDKPLGGEDLPIRHDRVWPGHPGLWLARHRQSWVAGPSPAMTEGGKPRPWHEYSPPDAYPDAYGAWSGHPRLCLMPHRMSSVNAGTTAAALPPSGAVATSSHACPAAAKKSNLAKSNPVIASRIPSCRPVSPDPLDPGSCSLIRVSKAIPREFVPVSETFPATLSSTPTAGATQGASCDPRRLHAPPAPASAFRAPKATSVLSTRIVRSAESPTRR